MKLWLLSAAMFAIAGVTGVPAQEAVPGTATGDAAQGVLPPPLSPEEGGKDQQRGAGIEDPMLGFEVELLWKQVRRMEGEISVLRDRVDQLESGQQGN